MKRITLTAVLVLAAGLVSFGAVATADAKPAKHVATVPKATLVSRTDFLAACRTEGVRTVDLVFTYKGKMVWQDTTGAQFRIVRDAQNPPWTCVTLTPVAVPGRWADR